MISVKDESEERYYDVHKDNFDKFFPYAQETLGFTEPVEVSFVSDQENAKELFGKTAQYEPNEKVITIYTSGRHPKDVLRSLSHELVHHTQNCRGEFDDEFSTEVGYALEDGALREMEKEAYLEGNLLLRDYEDTLKMKNGKKNEAKKYLKKLIEQELRRELKEAFYDPESWTDEQDLGTTDVSASPRSIEKDYKGRDEPAPILARKPSRRGSRRDPSVVELQTKLKAAGFDPGRIDGRMGPKTSKALASYQSSQGLPATGKPDAGTFIALNKAGIPGHEQSVAGAESQPPPPPIAGEPDVGSPGGDMTGRLKGLANMGGRQERPVKTPDLTGGGDSARPYRGPDLGREELPDPDRLEESKKRGTEILKERFSKYNFAQKVLTDVPVKKKIVESFQRNEPPTEITTSDSGDDGESDITKDLEDSNKKFDKYRKWATKQKAPKGSKGKKTPPAVKHLKKKADKYIPKESVNEEEKPPKKKKKKKNPYTNPKVPDRKEDEKPPVGCKTTVNEALGSASISNLMRNIQSTFDFAIKKDNSNEMWLALKALNKLRKEGSWTEKEKETALRPFKGYISRLEKGAMSADMENTVRQFKNVVEQSPSSEDESFGVYAEDPKFSKAKKLANKGHEFFVKKNFDKAAEFFQNAYDLDNNKPVYLRNAGRAYEEKGDEERAITLFKQYKKMDPSSKYAGDVDKRIAKLQGQFASASPDTAKRRSPSSKKKRKPSPHVQILQQEANIWLKRNHLKNPMNPDGSLPPEKEFDGIYGGNTAKAINLIRRKAAKLKNPPPRKRSISGFVTWLQQQRGARGGPGAENVAVGGDDSAYESPKKASPDTAGKKEPDMWKKHKQDKTDAQSFVNQQAQKKKPTQKVAPDKAQKQKDWQKKMSGKNATRDFQKRLRRLQNK